MDAGAVPRAAECISEADTLTHSDREASPPPVGDTAATHFQVSYPRCSDNPQSWGFAIKRQGEVLGSSFDVYGIIERVGKWNRKNQFETS